MDTQQSNSPDDIFESILNLEQTHHKEGYEEGYKHGVAAGNKEGEEVGLKTGFEIGEELGFYRGCIDVLMSVVQLPTRFSTRVQWKIKEIKQMDELIARYPVMDPENEIVGEIMDELRHKFKMIRFSLGLGDKLNYDGYPKPKDTEFFKCDE